MAHKIAINGFGRIGRLAFRRLFGDQDVEIVAINDLTDPTTLAHLLKFDSAQGQYKLDTIESGSNFIEVDGKKIKVFAERDPQALPWGELEIDLVIEATGFFASDEGSAKHIEAGAKKVVISAPAAGDVKTIVYNVNHEILEATDKIISAASCTTNCLAPVANILETKWGIENGLMTTVHAYTGDQKILDGPHKDLRRARAGAANIVPTTTGAAAAVGKVIPSTKGKLNGIAMRVPVITGSVVDLVFSLNKDASVAEINGAMEAAASETLGYTTDPLVSSDIIGTTYGSIVDSTLTSVIKHNNQKMFKMVMWYDNEYSYVCQLIRTVKYFANLK